MIAVTRVPIRNALFIHRTLRKEWAKFICFWKSGLGLKAAKARNLGRVHGMATHFLRFFRPPG